MSTQTTYFTLLLGQMPLLLIYFAGIIVCAILWRRAPLPAMLAIGGMGLMLLATLVSAGSSAWMIQRRSGGPTSNASIASVMMVVSIGTTIIRGGGLAMLVAGVFAERQREDLSGFEVQPATRFNTPSSPPSSPPPPPLR